MCLREERGHAHGLWRDRDKELHDKELSNWVEVRNKQITQGRELFAGSW